MKIVLSRGLELLGVPDGCPHCPLSMVRQIHKYNTFNGIGKTTLLLFCFGQIYEQYFINSFIDIISK